MSKHPLFVEKLKTLPTWIGLSVLIIYLIPLTILFYGSDALREAQAVHILDLYLLPVIALSYYLGLIGAVIASVVGSTLSILIQIKHPHGSAALSLLHLFTPPLKYVLISFTIGLLAHKLQQKQHQLELANLELKNLASTDGLTKLYNHRFFQEFLEKAIEEVTKANTALALLMIDIDHFKKYNDTYGHLEGDNILQQMAEILQEKVRASDTVFRYGGEEFAVVMPSTDLNSAVNIAERIRNGVEKHPFLNTAGQALSKNVTVSIGIASFPINSATKEELISKADQALYQAKDLSRNRVISYFSIRESAKQELNSEQANLLETLETLLQTINLRDRYTFGHSERVAKYASAIARSMGLPVDLVRAITYAGFLHDIGKIDIPKQILNKHGKLTEAEQNLIKQHTLLGISIIEPFNNLTDLLPVVRYHHERYDGQGYPEGLQGEAIPLGARILAVADSFDAMCSNRPYRNALSVEQAKNELIANAGSQFDPTIVDCFLRTLHREPELVLKPA